MADSSDKYTRSSVRGARQRRPCPYKPECSGCLSCRKKLVFGSSPRKDQEQTVETRARRPCARCLGRRLNARQSSHGGRG